jgi:uncharacterized protein YfeS
LYIAAKSARSFGGNTTYLLVRNYLEGGLGNYGSAVTQIEMTVCFRGGTVGNSSLQASHDEFHSVFLPSLPLVTFLRKKSRIAIKFETILADASFLERYGYLSAEMFGKALGEVCERLHLMDRRIKSTDDFSVARFYGDVAALVANAPTADGPLRELKARLDQEAKDRIAAMDPWEQLDIDWDDFHPAARGLLNDTFFWKTADDYAPHGNDTGSDLFSDFKKWNRKHPNDPAHRMATALLQTWGIARIDYRCVDEDAVSAMLAINSDAVIVTDEALIAAAFAAIKLRGFCDRQTRDFALFAIERERNAATLMADRGWKNPPE